MLEFFYFVGCTHIHLTSKLLTGEFPVSSLKFKHDPVCHSRLSVTTLKKENLFTINVFTIGGIKSCSHAFQLYATPASFCLKISIIFSHREQKLNVVFAEFFLFVFGKRETKEACELFQQLFPSSLLSKYYNSIIKGLLLLYIVVIIRLIILYLRKNDKVSTAKT